MLKPMFYILSFVLLFTGLLPVHAKDKTQAIELSIMSFNIRNGRANDGPNKWELRKEIVRDVIRESTPDIIGFQEAFSFQKQYLSKELPEYAEVGVGRDGGKRGEYSVIFYRKKQFKVIQEGTFWLSDTPEKPSRHWGNRYLRICTWALLLEKKTSRSFYVYNTHFDHESQNARKKSAELIMGHMKQHIKDKPVIFTGDFNAGEDNVVIQYLIGSKSLSAANPIPLVDTFRKLKPNETIVGTGNGRFKGTVDGPRIDYIFVRPGIDVLGADIVRSHQDGRYPSDHYPVTAKIRIP